MSVFASNVFGTPMSSVFSELKRLEKLENEKKKKKQKQGQEQTLEMEIGSALLPFL